MGDRDNVVILPVVTRLDIPPERVLNGALEADLEAVIVIGVTKDDSHYFSSSLGHGGEVLWLIERAKLALMQEGGSATD